MEEIKNKLFFVVKEEPPKEGEKALVSKMNHSSDWIIDSGWTHHMPCDPIKFIKMEECDGGFVKFGNDAPYLVKSKGSISLNDKTNCDNVYWVDGLK